MSVADENENIITQTLEHMKSKLNPVFLILGLFLFKMVVLDNYRFNSNNNSSNVASKPKKDITLAAIR